MTEHGGDTYMTFEEAAVYLGVSRRTIERYVKTGRLTRYRLGFKVVVKRADVQRISEPQADEEEDT